jgi:hypothetical protein
MVLSQINYCVDTSILFHKDWYLICWASFATKKIQLLIQHESNHVNLVMGWVSQNRPDFLNFTFLNTC